MGRAAPADTGAWLATRGAWDKNVPACNQCHGPGGIGVGDNFPALAGQSAAYISGQLRAWRQGQRPPGPLGLMPAVATRLTDAEIDAVSAYYAGLPQAAEQLAAQAAAPGQAMNPRLTRLPGAWLAAALALSMSATALAAEPRPSFTPPSAASLPDTEFGKIVRQENRSSCTRPRPPVNSSAMT